MDNKEKREKRHSSHQTQWAAQFAVASELCKRGYEVAFTSGNHPTVDLMVRSPGKESFFIDVKGLYKKNDWVVSRKEEQKNLYYVFAFVPEDSSNKFYVFTQKQVNQGIEEELTRAENAARQKGRTPGKEFECVKWKYAEKWGNTWNALPR